MYYQGCTVIICSSFINVQNILVIIWRKDTSAKSKFGDCGWLATSNSYWTTNHLTFYDDSSSHSYQPQSHPTHIFIPTPTPIPTPHPWPSLSPHFNSPSPPTGIIESLLIVFPTEFESEITVPSRRMGETPRLPSRYGWFIIHHWGWRMGDGGWERWDGKWEGAWEKMKEQARIYLCLF